LTEPPFCFAYLAKYISLAHSKTYELPEMLSLVWFSVVHLERYTQHSERFQLAWRRDFRGYSSIFKTFAIIITTRHQICHSSQPSLSPCNLIFAVIHVFIQCIKCCFCSFHLFKDLFTLPSIWMIPWANVSLRAVLVLVIEQSTFVWHHPRPI